MSRYFWIDARKTEGYDVRAACRTLKISTSAYYAFAERLAFGPTEAEWDEAILINAMVDIQGDDSSIGSPRMLDELRRRHGYCVNHKRVERLMAENGLYGVDGRRKKKPVTTPTDGEPAPLPDLVGRDFSAGEPAKRTCGDITYIPTDEGWLFLADVLDIGSRRIIGYAMDERMPTALVSSAMEMAIVARGGAVEGMIFHSDRGSQYLSHAYRRLCEENGIQQSVGRTGSSADNAVAESFWATLKRELISRFRFETRAQARRAIIAWIHRYNSTRLHSTLGNVPPIEWELRYAHRQLKKAA